MIVGHANLFSKMAWKIKISSKIKDGHTVLHDIDSAKMTSQNKICILRVSDVKLVESKSTFHLISVKMTRTRKEEVSMPFPNTWAPLWRSWARCGQREGRIFFASGFQKHLGRVWARQVRCDLFECTGRVRRQAQLVLQANLNQAQKHF